jgi:hypothetical protein
MRVATIFSNTCLRQAKKLAVQYAMLTSVVICGAANPAQANSASDTIYSNEKPRLFVLTDIGGDPDDQMSMVRLMTYANQFDIEGLVATPQGPNKDKVEPQRITQIVKAYGKVRDNLERHEPGYPSAKSLLNVISKSLHHSRYEWCRQGQGLSRVRAAH